MSGKKAGRPTVYREEYAEEARKLCELGATDVDLADFFEVHVATLHRWQAKHSAFCESLRAGKAAADERVERSLYHKAVGYSHDAVKIFMPAGAKKPVYAPYREHVPPDTTAAIFWLKNRRPQAWRDKRETTLTGEDGGPVRFTLDMGAGLKQAQVEDAEFEVPQIPGE